jgi:hypothetical protein
MIMRKRSKQSEKRCTRAAVKLGVGGFTVAGRGTSMTWRIHIRVSHETLAYLVDLSEPSPGQILATLNRYPSAIAFSRNLKSLLALPAYQRRTTRELLGHVGPSFLRCGIQKYVYFGKMALHFVCAEHGCTNESQY